MIKVFHKGKRSLNIGREYEAAFPEEHAQEIDGCVGEEI